MGNTMFSQQCFLVCPGINSTKIPEFCFASFVGIDMKCVMILVESDVLTSEFNSGKQSLGTIGDCKVIAFLLNLSNI